MSKKKCESNANCSYCVLDERGDFNESILEYTQYDIVYFFRTCINVRCYRCEEKRLKSRIKYNSVAFMVWFAIWLVFAVWRKVDIGVGGSDAITYVQYFNDCLNPRVEYFILRNILTKDFNYLLN